MSGVGEAGLVLGLISSTLTIFEAAQAIYEAASDTSGLPKRLRVVAEQIPLVYNALGLAEQNLQAKNVTHEAVYSAKPVLEQCKNSAAIVKDIFDQVIPAKDASRAERLRKAVGLKMKSNKAKEHMEQVFKSMDLLAQKQVFQDAETLEEIKAAMEQLTSISDEEDRSPGFIHSGAGAINANTGEGTQKNYNNSGPGSIYNAENQYFGRDQEQIDAQCLQHLRLTDPRDDKTRIEQTKGGLLSDSYRWILDNADYRQWRNGRGGSVLWIKGDPGKGKTMLLCGIIDELRKLKNHTFLLSFFFCQATDSRINSATAVLRGMIYLLVAEQPALISHVREKYDHASQGLFEDANAWVAITEIFLNILQDPSLKETYLIIDALDECMTGKSALLDLISQQASVSSRVKWVVSSRNQPDIEESFTGADHKFKLCLELNAESVSTAVKYYITYQVDRLAQLKKYNTTIKETVRAYLSSNANDTFLWVALVCQSLMKAKRWNVAAKLQDFPPGLDALYERMIYELDQSDDKDLLRRTLAIMSIVRRPITHQELTNIVETPDGCAGDFQLFTEWIGLCGSFLTLREQTIYFVHQSAKDFLLKTLPDLTLSRGRTDLHYSIFSQSLEIMSQILHRDIYGLEAPGLPIDQVQEPSVDPLVAVWYSCVYWVDHFTEWFQSECTKGGADLAKCRPLATFFEQKFLYWLEALSLCRGMSDGVRSIIRLEHTIKEKMDPYLVDIVRDGRRFLQSHKWVIENYPLQAYASALVFSPIQSVIRERFKKEKPKWMRFMPTIEHQWSSCLQTLEGHGDLVISVVFSHDGKHLASASDDRTVKIWDASEGTCLQTLKGHNDWINSVVFSHDGKHLISASDDRTVKIWNTSEGTCLQTLEGHSSSVNSVVFSHDGKYLASASNDRTVKIWDASEKIYFQTLKGHGSSVNSVVFSHDGKYLASTSDDRTVKIWNASEETCLQTLKGHNSLVNSVVFSYDSKYLASASNDRTVKIWDTNEETCLQTLKGHNNWVNSVVFSHDGKHLISASADRTVKIWNASEGTCLQTLEGHSSSVNSVVFSHDGKYLASASNDRTVKIWDASEKIYFQTLEGHSSSVNSVVFSHDGKYLASILNDRTVKIWDTSEGTCFQTLEGHSDRVSSVVFSHDGKHLASASDDRTIKIWDISEGICLQTLEGHGYRVSSVVFSHDDKHLASVLDNRTVKIWDASEGTCLQTLEGHGHWVSSIVFSHDDKYLASASKDQTVKIWDTSEGICLQTLKGHDDWVSSVVFSHDNKHLASASYDRTVKIWDASEGTCLQMLNVGRSLQKMSFDKSGSVLHSEIGAFCLDTQSTPMLKHNIADCKGLQQHGFGLSLDNKWIVRDSENMLWLPPDYRPSTLSVSASAIAIGCSTGQVIIIYFSDDLLQASEPN